MLAKERISQILPTVKCSDCGEDVQIRKLGDHICSNMPAVPPLPIIPAQRQDRAKMPPKSPSPISPLHSPNYDTNGRFGASSSTDSGYGYSSPVTPPYSRELRRPSTKDEDPVSAWDDGHYKRMPTSPRPFRDDSLRSEETGDYGGGRYSPKTPTFLSSGSERVRKNSTSPAPGDQDYYAGGPRSGSPWQQQQQLQQQQKYPPRGVDERSYLDDDTDRGYGSPKKTGGNTGALDTLMADLMSSFSSDIDQTDMRPDNRFKESDSCGVCGEDFDYRDDVVNNGNKYYHRGCFTCRLCRAPFDHRRPCFEHGGKLYCERDYNVVKKRIMCAGCERPITSNVTPIKALGQYYHPGHLKCYHCYEPIDERTGYKEHQGHVYCRKDFKAMFLPSCRACGRPVEREAVSAMDGKLEGKWHLDCFGCHTCHRPFPDNTFYVFDNAPYCKRHYHQLNNSLCRTCDDPIEGPCAQTIEGWRFHPACFRCNVCRCAITDIYYMFERHIYCETHIRQLQRQRNVRAEKRRTQFGRI